MGDLTALSNPTLDTMAAAYAAVVLERQIVISRTVELSAWSVDLDNAVLELGGLHLRVALLGSTHDASHTWQWAWDAPGYGPQHRAVAATGPLIELGDRFDVPELATGRIRLHGVHDAGQGPGHTLALVACGLLGAQAYYPAPYDGGTAWLTITDDQLPPATPTGADAVRVISAAVGMFPHDNRLTVETYLAVHDAPGHESGSTVHATVGGDDLAFTFSDDRLTDIS